MATSADYLTFVLEKLPPLGVVRSRKMFGEYMVYFNEKPVLLVCDNTTFVKKLPVLDNLMHDAPCGCRSQERRNKQSKGRCKPSFALLMVSR